MLSNKNCTICQSEHVQLFCKKNGMVYLKCNHCTHVFVKDYPKEEDLIQYYSNRTSHHASQDKEQWDFSKIKSHYVYKPLLDKINQFVPSGKLLDIGCSNGSFIKTACVLGWKAEGVELEKGSYEVSQKYNLNVYNQELISLKLPSDKYNVITMWQVIEHLNNPETIIEECCRILKPGGILAISTPNIQSIGKLLLKEKWGAVEPHVHLSLFTPKSLEQLLHFHNFKTRCLETLDIKPSTIKTFMKKNKTMEDKKESFAKFATTNSEKKMKRLLYLRNYLNILLNLFNLGEDIYGYFEMKA